MSNQFSLIANRGIPHVSEQIFSFLDDWSLTQCREVCHAWKEFIDTDHSRHFYQRFQKKCEKDQFFLHKSAYHGYVYIVKVIVKNTKDKNYLNKKDLDGWTPLHHAAFEGHQDIVKILLEFVKNKHPKGHDLGYSPLHLSTEKGFLSIVECFKSSFANK